MYNFAPEDINEHTLSQIMPLWKQNQTLQPKLLKISKGGKIILDFICSSVEFKLKKEILNQGSDQTLPEL